jgi:hypothetical protein
MRFVVPLLASMLLVGCPPTSGDPDTGAIEGDAGPPSLEIGTGEAAFEPVSEGGELELVHGPQDGYHVVGAVRMGGFDPDGTVLTYTVTDGGTMLVNSSLAILARRLIRDGTAYLKLGDLLVLANPGVGRPDVVGHTVLIEATVTRDGTMVASDTLSAVIVDRL